MTMFAHTDLALGRDSSSRFLPSLLAVMVYLAALAAVGALAARATVGDWDTRLAGTLTVQVPPSMTGEGREGMDAVLRLLRVTPGVVDARPLPPQVASQLLEPWLGAELVETLPMPGLIDVRIDGGQPFDLEALKQRLENAAPGTTLDDHGRWLADVRAAARAVTVVATSVLIVVMLAAVLAVVFTVRTGLAVHRNEIEILHLIGAPNGYIARQFQWHTAQLAIVGGLGGAALAVLSVVALQFVLQEWSSASGLGLGGLISLVQLTWLDWIVLGILPLATAGIAMITARVSVLIALARLA